ncbi:MAG: Fic family protein [Erysipelotrichales bacterium]|nr:Fic family protein [Erysipelotrichales bacterium]
MINRNDLLKKAVLAFEKRNGLRPIPQEVIQKYYDNFAIKNTYDSNAIEGNTITLNETHVIIKDSIMIREKSFGEHLDIVGYHQGFQHMLNAAREKRPISLDLIRSLHSFVRISREDGFYQDYRHLDVHDVEIVGRNGMVLFKPVASKSMKHLMIDYVAQINNDLKHFNKVTYKNEDYFNEVTNALAKHHMDFETIHPFTGGNGRTGRLLMNYELLTLGLSPVNIKQLDAVKYSHALYDYQHFGEQPRAGNGIQEMSDLILQSLVEELQNWNTLFESFMPGMENDPRANLALYGADTVLKNESENDNDNEMG